MSDETFSAENTEYPYPNLYPNPNPYPRMSSHDTPYERISKLTDAAYLKMTNAQREYVKLLGQLQKEVRLIENTWTNDKLDKAKTMEYIQTPERGGKD